MISCEKDLILQACLELKMVINVQKNSTQKFLKFIQHQQLDFVTAILEGNSTKFSSALYLLSYLSKEIGYEVCMCLCSNTLTE